MKLWKLIQTDEDVGWDAFVGFVIRAESEEAARQIAYDFSYGDEGKPTWTNPALSLCEHIGDGPGEPAIVLESFQAG